MSRPKARARTERASITPFAVIVALALLALGALVIDGGRQLNAKGRAIAYAEEAARAGAQMIDPTELAAVLDEGMAERAAAAYCTSAQANDDQLIRCDVSFATEGEGSESYRVMQVSTTIEIDTILGGIVGLNTLEASGLARARPFQGIVEVDGNQVNTQYPPIPVPPSGNPPTIIEDPTDTGTITIPCPTALDTTFTFYPPDVLPKELPPTSPPTTIPPGIPWPTPEIPTDFPPSCAPTIVTFTPPETTKTKKPTKTPSEPETPGQP